MKIENGGLFAVVSLAGSMATATLVSTDAHAQATTSNVAVGGSTVTATVSAAPNAVVAAEFFVDTIGEAGSGTAMTLSGDPLTPMTATGTLPSLPIGSIHTVYVHGEDIASVWGAYASATFTVDSTTVVTAIGSAKVSYFDFGTKYVLNFAPVEPCWPTDPCRVRSRFGTWNAADTLGYSRTTFNVPDGQMSLFTRVKAPTDPCLPQEPCRKRDVLIGFVATNGLKYSATTVDLDTTYLAK